MTPVLFEALLFLKANKEYWELNTVCKAIKRARSASMQKDFKIALSRFRSTEVTVSCGTEL